jgi:hypothetical protein
MESISPSMDPSDAGAQLAAAKALRSRLTEGLRLPPWFHSSIGAAAAIQMASAAVVVARPSFGLIGFLGLVGGVVVFLGVAAVQLLRFRRLNGVWVRGLGSQAVLGMGNVSSAVYGFALAGSLYGGLAGHWWLTALAAVAGGAGYALNGRRWWAAYLRNPAKNTDGPPALYAAGCFVLAFAGLAVLVMGRW